MTRLDEGFLGTPGAVAVLPKPDMRYDNLSGDERLSTLERALGSARGVWEADASSRAWDWLRTPGNAVKLIADFEVSGDVGAYSKVWDHFGWAHSSAADRDGIHPKEEQEAEVNRALALVMALPETTARCRIQARCSALRSVVFRRGLSGVGCGCNR